MENICGICKHCHQLVYYEGCGSSLCYVCLKNDNYRIIKIDGTEKWYLEQPHWCPGYENGTNIVPDELHKLLTHELAGIRYNHKYEGSYIWGSNASLFAKYALLFLATGILLFCLLLVFVTQN